MTPEEAQQAFNTLLKGDTNYVSLKEPGQIILDGSFSADYLRLALQILESGHKPKI